MRRRISKIIQHLGATEYTIPSSSRDYLSTRRDIEIKLHEYRQVLTRTDDEIHNLLSSIAFERPQLVSSEVPTVSPWVNWKNALEQERLICDVLKKCDTGSSISRMITAEGWVPTEQLDNLRGALHRAVRSSQNKQAALQIIRNPSSPPTYFKVCENH